MSRIRILPETVANKIAVQSLATRDCRIWIQYNEATAGDVITLVERNKQTQLDSQPDVETDVELNSAAPRILLYESLGP